MGGDNAAVVFWTRCFKLSSAAQDTSCRWRRYQIWQRCRIVNVEPGVVQIFSLKIVRIWEGLCTIRFNTLHQNGSGIITFHRIFTKFRICEANFHETSMRKKPQAIQPFASMISVSRHLHCYQWPYFNTLREEIHKALP